MSDRFYRAIRMCGRFIFRSSSRPLIRNAAESARPGRCLLAANHISPYDIPLMIAHAQRPLDFLSTTDAFRTPLLSRFYTALNAFPLDRSAPDPATVRILTRRLQRERMVAMFPEGECRRGPTSMINGGSIQPGVGRLAIMTGTPVLPCAVYGSVAYTRPINWLPLKRTRYGIAFGSRITPPPSAGSANDRAAAAHIEHALCCAIRELYNALRHDLTPEAPAHAQE